MLVPFIRRTTGFFIPSALTPLMRPRAMMSALKYFEKLPCDTGKNINKDRFDVGILVHDFKCSDDLLIGGSSSNIQEVSWFAAMTADQIHCSHCQTGSINHTSDVSIKWDVVEIVSLGFDFSPVLLSKVFHHEYVLLSVGGVVVDVNFVVTDKDFAFDWDT